MKNNPYKAEIYLAINIAVALVMLLNSKLSTLYSVLIVMYGVYKIMASKNRDGAAHIYAAYVVGIEVLFRLNSGGFGYEYGKYAVVFLLSVGFLVEQRKKTLPFVFLLFILCLLPSIPSIDFPTFDLSRQYVSFNLSGPLSLAISAIYFYRRRINLPQLRRLLLAMLYPIAAMSIFVYFKSGSLEEATFTTESNFQTSGGFGPNQVSTIFGLGILIIAISYFLGIKLFRLKFVNIILLLGFLIRGLATFSRGGMLSPIVAIVLCIVIMTLTDSNFKVRIGKVVYAFLIIGGISLIGFNYVNDASEGLLEMRFKGESMYNKDKSNLFSGRLEIFDADIEIFKDNVLTGVGPGMSAQVRSETQGIEAAAHIEYSRMLAEHGLFGILAMAIMVLFPIKYFFEQKSIDNKILLIMCLGFVFMTLGHAAMRTAAPGFVYGMAFLNIVRRPRA
ncbi:MAG TPA: O-antigen ligase family protein [Ignavibacteria bacterium]|nr:O-antigen ligase family protein [Ignavibacteria bacterium]